MGIVMPAEKRYVLVIVPTYNRAGLLPLTIESVLSQDYPHKKLIIVDDGSTDTTRELCVRYTREHPETISYRYQANSGCASARNAGLEAIDEGTDYVCFLDSDDQFLPHKLSREVTLLDAHPDAGFCYSDCVMFEEQRQTEQVCKAAAAGAPERFAIELFLTLEAKSSAILYRAETVRHRRFREDLRYNEDSDFLQKIALEHPAVYCPEPGCWIRDHAGSKSRNFIEINKAVLGSYHDIVRTYPDFYRRHARAIDRRIEQIRKSLYREVLKNGLYVDARQLAATPLEALVATLRLRGYYGRLGKWKAFSRKLRRREK
jgi:glycosyltransferase involved in cell wall biosynthesis